MPVPAHPPVANAAMSRAETAIVRQINRARHAHGLRGVRISPALAGAARQHSVAMLSHDSFSHSSFDGSSFRGRLRRAGNHRRYGETLAWAPRGSHAGARTIVRMWLNSAAHRAVLLDGTLHHIGVARVYGALGSQAGNAITADFSS